MKKLLCLIVAFVFTLLLTTVGFAATEDIDDTLTPLSPDTTTNLQYEEIETIIDEDVAESAPASDTIAQVLPQTGGIPAEAFYVLGGACIVSALFITRKKGNTAEK